MKYSALLAALILAAAPMRAEIFEGKIVYELQTPKQEAQPVKMYLAHFKSRMEMEAKGHKSVIIMDAKARTLSILMTERKSYMVESLKSGSTGAATRGSLRKTGNHEMVAGYPTEEWIYETDKGKTELWLTDRLGRGLFAQEMGDRGPEIPAELKNKDVLALKIVGSHGFSMEAKKVEPGPVDSELFEIPGDYSQMAAGTQSAGASSGSSGGSMKGAMNSMPPDAAQKMQQALDNLSPEQKAAMQKALQGQGNP